MVSLAYVLLGLAAVVHVCIFWLESFAWTASRTRAAFGTSPEEAEVTRALAYNQGFYNLFLAVVVAAAIVLRIAGHTQGSVALAIAGAGSMVAAAVVLATSDHSKLRAAAIQGAAPALGLIALAFTG
ncbi:DUF1304 domain-containing protein [Allobranchiibius sp. CTAmp26]|uniref:DUF1304 domain-containing protein n=1 Tax=Allobranchiibius sp. CTAmp26 TaxID=2815214 RepID=UPI001AA1BFBE|nr:DUF1304 domain-containing protein [Allobranchiibius sp. CTAmp26]MBO1754259.1 DUF1304 domain-containing protein [Allobranchiibius sp. CTAmp26]